MIHIVSILALFRVKVSNDDPIIIVIVSLVQYAKIVKCDSEVNPNCLRLPSLPISLLMTSSNWCPS